MEIVWVITSLLTGVITFFIGWKIAVKPIENNNQKIREEYDALIQLKEQQEQERKKELLYLDSQISSKWNSLQKIEDEYCSKLKTINDSKDLANKAFEDRKNLLEKEFNEYEEEYKINKQILQNEIEKIQKELNSLKATKNAAIAAAQKEKEIQQNKDFYCLIIPKEEKRDIEILKNVKYQISKPRAVSMIIWSHYYQVIAKSKFPKILGKNDVCGIYKITNQKTGQCYIGQAVDVRKRWYEHCKASLGIDTPQGSKLYAAMQEDGLENFSFELLEECPQNKLNEKEKYFIELYQADTLGYNGNKGRN